MSNTLQKTESLEILIQDKYGAQILEITNRLWRDDKGDPFLTILQSFIFPESWSEVKAAWADEGFSDTDTFQAIKTMILESIDLHVHIRDLLASIEALNSAEQTRSLASSKTKEF